MAKAKRPPQTKKKLGGPRVGGDGPRQNKVDAVKEFRDRVEGSTAVIVTEYRGMTVGQLAELRAGLRDAEADYKVVKNTLATIAVRDLGLDELIAQFEGPTAFTFTRGDPVAAAKKLSDFAKKVPSLVLKGGLLDKRLLTAKDVSALGSLESREVMLTKAAGMFISPIQKLANLFAAPLNQLGAVLAQLREKLPVEQAAPEVAEPEAAVAEAVGPEASPEAVVPEASTPDGGDVSGAEPTTEDAGPAAETAEQAPEAEAPPANETTEG